MTQLEPAYDRPPEGLARGRWPVPAWIVAALALVVVLGACALLFVRARRSRRAAHRGSGA